MNITYKDPRDLIDYENNPRKNEDAVEIVEESIRRYGFKVPCLITEDYEDFLGICCEWRNAKKFKRSDNSKL